MVLRMTFNIVAELQLYRVCTVPFYLLFVCIVCLHRKYCATGGIFDWVSRIPDCEV